MPAFIWDLVWLICDEKQGQNNSKTPAGTLHPPPLHRSTKTSALIRVKWLFLCHPCCIISILTNFSLQKHSNEKTQIFTFWVMTFDLDKLEKHTISQKKHLNMTNLEYFMWFVFKMTISALDSVIYQSQIFINSVYTLNITSFSTRLNDFSHKRG